MIQDKKGSENIVVDHLSRLKEEPSKEHDGMSLNESFTFIVICYVLIMSLCNS